MINRKLISLANLLKNIQLRYVNRRYSSAKRINESDPINHSVDHIGRFYRIPDTDFSLCFEAQIKKDFSRLLTLFNDKSIIIRSPAVEVIDYIKASDLTRPIVRYVFYGPVGAGKTVQLAHVSHYLYRRKDWLLLHCPNPYDFLNASPELTVNSQDETMFDTPSLSVAWLQSFVKLNKDFLNEYNPKTLKPIQWNQKENLPAGSSWTEMINFGISRSKYSSDCIGVLLREAREHAQLNEFKVLGIIRGLNCLFQLSCRADLSQSYIKAERISVLKYFRRLIKNDWCNGAIICSVNLDTVYRRNERESFYPKYLLGNEGIKEMDPCIPIHVGHYTDQEVSNYLHFLNENNWLVIPEAKDPCGIGRKEIAFLADNLPEELFNVTKEW